MRCLQAVASLFLLCTAVALVGARQPTFRTETTLVRTDVTVLDADHKMVRGLTRHDFRIVVDGVPQQIALFEAISSRASIGSISSRSPGPCGESTAARLASTG
jgi:hypothetical protein